mgnify:CR=1 FL=1
MIGRKLVHYEITALLGKGGMGEVYLAEDVRLGRQVAIKILPPDLTANTERKLRFQREAETAAGLSHPNIAVIHEVGEFEGAPYLVMELLVGRTLHELAGKRALPHPELPAYRKLEQAPEVYSASFGLGSRDLQPGDEYVPMVPPNVTVPEITARSIVFGLTMNILFAMSPDTMLVVALVGDQSHRVLLELFRVLLSCCHLSPQFRVCPLTERPSSLGHLRHPNRRYRTLILLPFNRPRRTQPSLPAFPSSSSSVALSLCAQTSMAFLV